MVTWWNYHFTPVRFKNRNASQTASATSGLSLSPTNQHLSLPLFSLFSPFVTLIFCSGEWLVNLFIGTTPQFSLFQEGFSLGVKNGEEKMVWSSQSAANAYLDTLKLVRVLNFNLQLVFRFFSLLAHQHCLSFYIKCSFFLIIFFEWRLEVSQANQLFNTLVI